MKNYITKDIQDIWQEIVSKPKWYAGVRTINNTYCTAQNALKMKRSFEKGTLDLDIITRVFNAHNYEISIIVKDAN